MQKTCRQCSAEFDIRPSDLDFYRRISPVFAGRTYDIPPPRLCPECREQHRFAFRNEWSLYRRPCDLSGRPIVAIYSPEKPYKVYEQSRWWSDEYDPLAYGRDFDFRRPFFEQWNDLSLAVPRLSIHNAKSENCEYTNYSSENKDCYMAMGCVGNEGILYGYRAAFSKDLVDCYDPFKCELCYEVTQSKELHSCRNCTQCQNSSNLILCASCSGCRDCFGCVNLRQKRFHIFNEEYSEQDYRRCVEDLLKNFDKAKEQFETLRLRSPSRAADVINCEGSSGDRLLDCKNCHDVYVFKTSEDCSYGSFCHNMKSSLDANFGSDSELLYLVSNQIKDYNVIVGNLVWYTSNSFYVTSCFNSSDLFGCIGMKKHQYCILNKQYSREDYLALVPRIIEHMQSTSEWGEYFPPKYSPFAYNETAAQDYYPESEDVIRQLGWQWHPETLPADERPRTPARPPRSIAEAGDEVTKQLFSCSVTGKPYRIVPQELSFYRKMNIAPPDKCPEQRRKERLASQNPHRIWNRPCAKCRENTLTSYAPFRKEVLYCERCYLQEIY